MRSMTGYGASIAKNANVELEIQIRSVNSRFLDLRFHLPKEYLGFEADLKKRCAKILQRGCLDVFVHRRPNAESGLMPIRFNKTQAKAWLASVDSLKKTLGLKENLTLKDILTLPHVFEVNERLVLDKAEEVLVKKVFDNALKACQKSREQEGTELRKEIQRLLASLATTVQALQPWREKAQARVEKRLQERLKEAGGDVDPARVAMETALQLDKMDIREELVRLGEHVKACQNWTKGSEIHGKKLDFYAQELLREANTIGSKIQSADMTELVVKAKTIIENFREQVQNVE
jgi:uncharacterized protein (TIGR00255 family)